MIMNVVLLTTMIILLLALTTSNNPLKTSVALLSLSSLSFLSLKLESGSIWFPLLMFMLFTGGILMMFMILSSIMPNEKAMKGKFNWTKILLISLSMSMLAQSQTPLMENFSETKAMISSPMLFLLMMIMILIYLFLSLELGEKESSPMRSVQCRMGKQFCKLLVKSGNQSNKNYPKE